MNLNSYETERNSIQFVFQMLQNIEAPLSSLMDESEFLPVKEAASNEIIFKRSHEIKALVDEAIGYLRSNLGHIREPLFFTIYNSTPYVQSICGKKIDSEKMCEQEKTLLLNLENKVLKYLDRSDINLSDLAFDVAISKRQLNRKIHTLLHLTPNKYIRVLKMYWAKQFIDNYSYDTIAQLSYAVGYRDTHYFSKLFAYQYNATPKELLDAKK